MEGDVAATPLTRYRYPATRSGEGESIVAAYLFHVRQQDAPGQGETSREPTWVDPDEAIRLLGAGGRAPTYAEEHARVVREAVAALAG